MSILLVHSTGSFQNQFQTYFWYRSQMYDFFLGLKWHIRIIPRLCNEIIWSFFLGLFFLLLVREANIFNTSHSTFKIKFICLLTSNTNKPVGCAVTEHLFWLLQQTLAFAFQAPRLSFYEDHFSSYSLFIMTLFCYWKFVLNGRSRHCQRTVWSNCLVPCHDNTFSSVLAFKCVV